jgi:hypothetical protein
MLVQLLLSVTNPATIQLSRCSPEDLAHRRVTNKQDLTVFVTVGNIACIVIV